MAAEPNMMAVWDAFTGYQRTGALKAAIELDVFTEIAAGTNTIDALAEKCGAAPRGLRALLGRLVADELVARVGDHYELTPTASTFLDRNGPGYVGSAITFIGSAKITECFARLTDAVRKGGTAVPDDGTLSTEDPVWIDFA